MRCDDVRDRLDTLWDAALPPEVKAHVAECASCSAHHRDMLMLHGGLGLWKQDEAPAPSVGFAQRLVRQLASKPPAIADFLERVGRRVCVCHPGAGPLRRAGLLDTLDGTLALPQRGRSARSHSGSHSCLCRSHGRGKFAGNSRCGAGEFSRTRNHQ